MTWLRQIVATVTSSVLPTGASTSAKQDTGNTSLASVDTKLTSQATAAKQDTLLAALSGAVDSNNSSTATLNAAAVFTGTATDVSSHSALTIACKTDKDGTLNAQFSPDGTNWDSSLTYSVAANTNEVHRLTVTRKYFRVMFTNTSASNQTFFRLQVIVGNQNPLSAPLNLALQLDSDGVVVRPTDADLEVARGLRGGISSQIKFGRSLAATAGTDVWAAGIAYVEPATAATLSVVSSSASDTAAGTGGRTLFVTYIASDYSEASTTVTLNGKTPVTIATGWHVNRAYVATAGSAGSLVGDLTITSAAAGTPTVAKILANKNQTQSSIYWVPLGYTLYIRSWQVGTQSSNSNGTSDVELQYKPFGGVFRTQDNMVFREGGNTSETHVYESGYRVFDPKGIVKVRVTAASAALDIHSNYTSKLVQN